jgi:hypothetical protein
MTAVLQAHHVDAVLLLATTNSGWQSSWVRGGTVSWPVASYEAKLQDLASGQTAWILSANTRGDALFSDLDSVLDSFCEAVAEKLLADGVVKTSPATTK